jgi:glycosyltransferase involved in cell wall biosynthesis
MLRKFSPSAVGNWLQTYQRASQIFRIVKKERSTLIVTCTGDLYDLPAAYLASRRAGLRYYIYLFDDYFYQWPGDLERSFAQRWERILIKGATGVVVPNEFLCQEYRCRHGIEPVVIHNPCEELRNGGEEKVPWPMHPGEIKIVYTGAVYHAHYDAFHNLIAAIPKLRGPEVKLHLYTAQSPAELERARIKGPVVYHPHLPLMQIGEVQRRADILFLPLAFVSTIPEVIKTSAPGKMGEYLSSGRPILVHAPADSFLTWYFKKYECGVVVSNNDPVAIESGIRSIIENNGLREQLKTNALLRGRLDFGLGAARSEFTKLLKGEKES